jgi:hypothetical protein
MEGLVTKIQHYDPRVVIRDNWKQVKKIVKWAVTAGVFTVFGTEEPISAALSSVITKIILDFIDYLITQQPGIPKKKKT